MDLSSFYAPAGLLVAYHVFKTLKFRRVRVRIPEMLAQGAVVIDVRSPEEFASGARPDSLNIPLHELAGRAGSLDRAKPVIVCCASGARSAMAAMILKRQGFERVENAGTWRNTLV